MDRRKPLSVVGRVACVPITAIGGIKQAQLVALASSAATLLLVSSPAAQAGQCSAEKPPDAQTWWSWRIIDGRKCWYEGKPKISKSLLQWDARAPSQTESEEGIVTMEKDKSNNALDAQALAPKEDETFEARWRTRAITK
jgi:hypothetical protein